MLINVYREVGAMLRGICKDFIINFCFVPAIKVPFFSFKWHFCVIPCLESVNLSVLEILLISFYM